MNKRTALFDMLPGLPPDDVGDSGLGNAVAQGKVPKQRAFSPFLAHSANLIRGQFGTRNALTTNYPFRVQARPVTLTCGSTALARSIPVVVALSAEKEVIGADTLSHITLMQYAQARWNRTKVKLIRVPMCRDVRTANVELGVTPAARAPQPATVNRLFDVLPKGPFNIFLRPVPFDKSRRLTPDLAQGTVRSLHKCGRLPAPTFTQPRGTDRAGLVAHDEAVVLPLIGIRRRATTALTKVRSIKAKLDGVWYTFHAGASTQVLAIPRTFVASRGLFVASIIAREAYHVQ